MDISNIEKVLLAKKINYKINSDASGIDIKFGWFAGSIFVKYDRENDSLIFGSKFRWIIYALMVMCWIGIFTTNMSPLSNIRLIIQGICVVFIFTPIIARELKLFAIKKSVES